MVVPNSEKGTILTFVRMHTAKGSNLYTDALSAYSGMAEWYRHRIVDHAVSYVVDNVVHRNGLENFWLLLKRTMRGTYVSVEPFHLHRYLGEYGFRFNNRKTTGGERFNSLAKMVNGKRLTYAELIAQDTVAV
jgi:transposase-like protein